MINKQNITSGLFICWNIVFLEHFSILMEQKELQNYEKAEYI